MHIDLVAPLERVAPRACVVRDHGDHGCAESSSCGSGRNERAATHASSQRSRSVSASRSASEAAAASAKTTSGAGDGASTTGPALSGLRRGLQVTRVLEEPREEALILRRRAEPDDP